MCEELGESYEPFFMGWNHAHAQEAIVIKSLPALEPSVRFSESVITNLYIRPCKLQLVAHPIHDYQTWLVRDRPFLTGVDEDEQAEGRQTGRWGVEGVGRNSGARRGVGMVVSRNWWQLIWKWRQLNSVEKNAFHSKWLWGWTVSTLDVEAGEAGRGSRDDLVNQ